MHIDKLVGLLEAHSNPIDYETDDTKDGCAVKTLFFPDERYLVDFADGFTDAGWIQFDTNQDAHYFGCWVNPRLFMTMTYAEGDWKIVRCHDAERYNRSVQRMCEFYGEGFIAKAIDCEAKTCTTLRQDRAECFASVTA